VTNNELGPCYFYYLSIASLPLSENALPLEVEYISLNKSFFSFLNSYFPYLAFNSGNLLLSIYYNYDTPNPGLNMLNLFPLGSYNLPPLSVKDNEPLECILLVGLN